MISCASFRRWLLRDLPHPYIFLGCAAIVVSVIIYVSRLPELQSDFVARRQMNDGENGNDEQRYTGSIIIPMRRQRCLKSTFDNRTGQIIYNGNINCDDAAPLFTDKNPPRGMDVLRLRAVGKAFRHETN